MRSAQKSNRSRGRGNRKSGGGGGNNINRVYDSAGPEGKVRGTPQQIIDKYLSLARDAQTSGDRVTAENFLQHAEHYQRILITAMQAQEQQRRDNQETAEHRGGGDNAEDSVDASDSKQPEVQPDPAAAPQPEIGGMAMIDAGEGGDQLLVTSEAEENPAPKPRGNGDGRRRSRKQAEPAPAAAEAPAPEAPAEAPAEGS